MQQVLKADENINYSAIGGEKKTSVIRLEICIGDCWHRKCNCFRGPVSVSVPIKQKTKTKNKKKKYRK